MSGICSKHMGFSDPNCRLCSVEIPKESEFDIQYWAAFPFKICDHCGFKFYLTITFCPLCGKSILPG